MAAGGSAGNTPQKLVDSVSRATSERSRVAQEVSELKQALDDSRASQRELANANLELRQALDERSADLDLLKKRMNREIPINNGLQEPIRNSRSSSPQSPSSKYDLAAARDEITGLKYVLILVIFFTDHYVTRHIVRTLQQESQSATQRNKLLESENRLLVTETDQLREVWFVLNYVY